MHTEFKRFYFLLIDRQQSWVHSWHRLSTISLYQRLFEHFPLSQLQYHICDTIRHLVILVALQNTNRYLSILVFMKICDVIVIENVLTWTIDVYLSTEQHTGLRPAGSVTLVGK